MSGGTKQVLQIDGSGFDDYAGFGREFSMLLSDYEWRENLDIPAIERAVRVQIGFEASK